MSTSSPAAAVEPAQQPRYKLIIFIPRDSAKQVLDALFAAHPLIGQIGEYDHISFTTSGTARFTPSAHAKPFIGQPGVEELVEEVRVETQVRGREAVRCAVEAIKRSHPYEEAVYEVYKLEDF